MTVLERLYLALDYEIRITHIAYRVWLWYNNDKQRAEALLSTAFGMTPQWRL